MGTCRWGSELPPDFLRLVLKRVGWDEAACGRHHTTQYQHSWPSIMRTRVVRSTCAQCGV